MKPSEFDVFNRGYLRGLKSCYKMLRFGQTDIEIVKELILREARMINMMQGRSKDAFEKRRNEIQEEASSD